MIICAVWVLAAVGLAIAFPREFKALVASNVLGSPDNSEALQRTRERFSQEFTTCGDTYYGHFPSPLGLFEFKTVSFSVAQVELTSADRLNGTDWKGSGKVNTTLIRHYDGRNWSDWGAENQFVNPNGNLAVYGLEKRHGQWQSGERQGLLMGMAISAGMSPDRQVPCEQIPK